MTVMAERTSQMSVEDFEELSAAAPETVTLEFINGRLEVKPVTDNKHAALIAWLVRQCMQARPELDLVTTQQLKVERYRKGRAVPDGTLVPIDHLMDQDEDWADPKGVLMTVEVTSYDSDTESRDRREKPAAYAAAGIPVYLLVDRDRQALLVHTGPDLDHGQYLHVDIVPFGEKTTLPEPVGIALDTEPLKKYVR
ncbi:Uma2 family endonuclease [Streptomyces boluensis]|uniref:Uma2 family endonuclease n=1 Tax=Streptomyces boluensis TaxID=1775135 RepID=A0A964UU55_9ACTN|nr:Uma2 family endonuclease [Streptomyces boluensis]NBE55503.1 Uma2 family endonuclease [Streptomyces boluensis]